MYINKISEFDNIDISDISDLYIVYDNTYDSNLFIFDHILDDNKTIIDCVKWYNRIWSIRQNVNLHIANMTGYEFDISFNNIHYAFSDTKKAKQKAFLLQSLHFFRYVKRIHHGIKCRFDDTVFKFDPNFYIQYEVPITSGDVNRVLSEEDFIRFICFLIVYGVQSLLIITKHFKFRDKIAKLKKYDCHFDISFHNSLKSSGNFIIDKKYIHDKIISLDIGANYKKFFEG